MTQGELNPQSAGSSALQPARSIGFDEFVETTSSAVMRALEARNTTQSSAKLPFPIVIGIIYLPQGLGNVATGQIEASAGQGSTGS